MHLDDGPARRDPAEEVTFLVPGSEKVAIMAPLGALERFLPVLAEASHGIEQRCPSCEQPLGEVPARWLGRR
jgi:hypothetical protein